MKKLLFYILLVIDLYLLVTIIEFLINSKAPFDSFGSGFLIGKFLLFAVFGMLCIRLNPYRKIKS